MSQHILVVDDEADIEALFRQQFRRELKAGRFRMEFATSAQQALRVIEGADGRDIVLLLSDINMPGMSGLDLLPRAKAVRPDLAVIMVTAYGDLETRRRAAEGGAEGLLPKPIDFAALRAEIDRRLGQRRAGP
jgi:DNA-binding NtrC family response regulator